MVFEGKLLTEPNTPLGPPIVEESVKKTSEEPVKKVLEESVKSVETPKATNSGKKSHTFRNLFISTFLLGSLFYAGGAYYSLQNDTVHDLFVDHVPLGASLMDLILNRRFKESFNSISAVTAKKSSDQKPASGLESVSIPKSGATWKAVDEPVDAGTTNIAKPGPHLSAKPKIAKLPLIETPQGADSAVTQSIATLNEFITSINDSKYTSEHVEKISQQLNKLAAFISEIKTSVTQELNRKVQEAVSQAGSAVDNTSAEFVQAVEAQKAKWTKTFHEEQQRLTASYNERLKNEIEAANKVIFTHASNQLLAVNAEREKKFTDEIRARVEAERDGRLANLEQLSASLEQVQQLTIEADKAISEADATAKLHIAIGRLRTALQSDNPVALRPYIEAIRAAAQEDPLLLAAIDSIPRDVYDLGVLTRQQLAARFHLLQPEIKDASLLPPNAGIAGHIGSLIFSKLLWTKSSAATGDDVGSVMARANEALANGNIVDAVAEVNTLQGWPKRLAHDWLVQGRNRSEVEFLVELIAEEGKLYGI